MFYLSTYSIVAFDKELAEFGIAVQSRAFRAGAIVPHAKARVGAIASQAMANLSYGPKGLELLKEGLSAQETVQKLTSEDEQREHRQLAVIDSKGRIAQHTGSECLAWAGHKAGINWAAQGNILVSKEVIEAMGEAFEKTDGILAEKLMAALEAAQAVGGDRRGQQAGGILVVRPNAYFDGVYDRLVDVRIDDHPEPIKELRRLLGIALPSVYLLNTRFFLEQKSPKSARDLLDRALAKDPEQLLLRLALAGYYAHTQKRSEALREIELALAKAGADQEGFKRYLKTNALFKPLQNDTEFQRLIL
ncbi:DUF1028 domain-containing protein [Candidatus Acetothermia bacterium]|jgi:uncharacterized Ntn-hydrolase superfamily protein|nr:DUF1028 domain-containing protein [Candidatus Acetothermia bacterium]MCI2432676.1 DUF1028 domain-containing protein [Candidatus Acetothermia bacterium]MCI2436064.1 DUF1028 domain-containing protein [Candidatus Acetothermia bacterium]